MDAAAFTQALERALASAVSGALRVPAVTAIVANPADRDALGVALPLVVAALDRAGVPRGRTFVLLAAPAGTPADADTVRALRAIAGVPVLAHDPGSPSFALGLDARRRGIRLSDDLREAEAIVLLGSLEASAVPLGLAGLLHPGLAPAGAPALDAREVAERIGVDLCVTWSLAAAGGVDAWAGEGLAVEDRARAATRASMGDSTPRIP